MYVHVVKKGENIQQIAHAVGVEAEEVAIVNGLADERPVPGSSLLIPTQVPTTLRTYATQEGDTVKKIANLHHIPERIARAANGSLPTEPLPAGRVLTLPVPIAQKRAIEVNVRFDVQGDPEERLTLQEARHALSSLSVATAWIGRDGSLRLPDHWSQALQAQAQAAEARQLLLVAPDDEQAARRLLVHPATRRNFYRDLRAWIAADEFLGVHVEFPRLPSEMRVPFNRFMRELAVRVHHLRGLLYVGVPPHAADDPDHPVYGAYDLAWLSRCCDRVVWNVDDAFGRADGPPTSLAPLHQIKRTLAHAVTLVPKRKLLLGLPCYGYDWPVPYDPERAAALLIHGPMSLPEEEGEFERPKQVHWDEVAMSPMFTYRDDLGERREVWYEDARSLAAKLHLVHEWELAGISCQVPGDAMLVQWCLLQDLFQIRKGTGLF